TDGANWTDVTVFTTGMVVTVDGVGSFTITGISGNRLEVAETVTDGTSVRTIRHNPLTATLDGPVIDLLPDKSEARDADLHTVIRADKAPIGNLVDGQTYYVVNATANTFQLALTPGGTPIALDTTGLGAGVAHLIGYQGVDLAPASGEQELRIDVTSGVTGYQALLGPGGVPLNTLAPTGGNGVSTAVSHGSGRGLFFGGARNTSTVSYTSTVRAHSGSSSRLISGGDVGVIADSSLVVDAYTKNSSGGLVSDGNSRSFTAIDLTTEAYVDTGSTVFADGNLTVSAATDSTGKAQGDAKGGAIILSGSADANVSTTVSYTTTARLGSDVDALVRGLATISSDTATTGRAEADAKGGGFALNGQGDSDAVVSVSGTTTSELASNAILEAYRSLLRATGSRLDLYADAWAKGSGLRARANSDATVSTNATARVLIGADAELTGIEGVDLVTNWSNVATRATTYARSSGAFGRSVANSHNSTNLTSRITGTAGAKVTAGPRAPSGDGLAHPSGFPRLALYMNAENGPSLSASYSAQASRASRLAKKRESRTGSLLNEDIEIPFSSDVVILSGRSPQLVIDAGGNVALAIEASVNDSPSNAARTSGLINSATVVVNDISNPGTGDVYVNARKTGSSTGGAARITGSGGTWEIQYTLPFVRITNLSSKTLVLNNINVVSTRQPLIWLSPDAGGAVSVSITFDLVNGGAATLVDVYNATSSTVSVNGTIENPVGTTAIRTGGDVQATKVRESTGGDGRFSLIRTNILYLTTPAGGIGTAANRLNVDLVEASTFPRGLTFRTRRVNPVDGSILIGLIVPFFNGQQVRYTTAGSAIGGLTNGLYYWVSIVDELRIQLSSSPTLAPLLLLNPATSSANTKHTLTPSVRTTVEAAEDVWMDVQGRLRDPSVTDFHVLLDQISSLQDVDILLREGVREVAAGSAVCVLVQWPASPGGTAHCSFFTPDAGPSAPGLGIFGSGGTAAETTYDFRALDQTGVRTLPGVVAGGNIVIRLANPSAPYDGTVEPLPSATPVNVLGITEVLTTGRLDVLTNGWITIYEKSGDLQVGRIRSVADDVLLATPRMIVDILNDAGSALAPVVHADVSGDDITMCAAVPLPTALEMRTAANPGCVDGGLVQGGIGTPANFLETDVDTTDAATPGVLRAFDIYADSTQGIYLDEVVGDMKVHTIWTTENISLRTVAGSIVDARDGGFGDDAADVLGQAVDIDANGGSIGDTGGGNDLELDSRRGSPAAGLEAGGDDVALEASTGIYLTETDAELRLALAHATGGNIRLTVRESADLDENFLLIRSGSARFAEGNASVPGLDPDADRAIPRGQVFAEAGSVELRVGDDVLLHQATEILAARDIDIRGDDGNADPTFGTNMTLRGKIVAGCVLTAGDPVGTCAPSTANPVYLTEIWGHTDVDTIQLGDPSGIAGGATHGDPGYIFIGSKTIARGGQEDGSSLGDDGEDRFVVWYLQDADVTERTPAGGTIAGAGHSLTLDGQADSDTYTVYTTGSRGDARHYVINVLDTGASDDGVDEAAIYGFDSPLDGIDPGSPVGEKYANDDLFLLRATKCVDTESEYG
ncbi:MAG: beta strand repeat-containing protein, partial [Gaiellaceae bacterium]